MLLLLASTVSPRLLLPLVLVLIVVLLGIRILIRVDFPLVNRESHLAQGALAHLSQVLGHFCSSLVVTRGQAHGEQIGYSGE